MSNLERLAAIRGTDEKVTQIEAHGKVRRLLEEAMDAAKSVLEVIRTCEERSSVFGKVMEFVDGDAADGFVVDREDGKSYDVVSVPMALDGFDGLAFTASGDVFPTVERGTKLDRGVGFNALARACVGHDGELEEFRGRLDGYSAKLDAVVDEVLEDVDRRYREAVGDGAVPAVAKSVEDVVGQSGEPEPEESETAVEQGPEPEDTGNGDDVVDTSGDDGTEAAGEPGAEGGPDEAMEELPDDVEPVPDGGTGDGTDVESAAARMDGDDMDAGSSIIDAMEETPIQSGTRMEEHIRKMNEHAVSLDGSGVLSIEQDGDDWLVTVPGSLVTGRFGAMPLVSMARKGEKEPYATFYIDAKRVKNGSKGKTSVIRLSPGKAVNVSDVATNETRSVPMEELVEEFRGNMG